MRLVDDGVLSLDTRAEGGSTATVLANTSSGAWPIARVLREQLQIER